MMDVLHGNLHGEMAKEGFAMTHHALPLYRILKSYTTLAIVVEAAQKD